MKQKLTRQIMAALLFLYIDAASAQTFTKMGSAVIEVLGTKKAVPSKITVDGKSTDLFTAKETGKVAVVQKAIYEPNCTHTWVIGLDQKTAKVEKIQVVEMSCPHAFPAQKASYLEQYTGKGPADIAKLKDSVKTIAKATGTCNLTTDAVVTAVKAVGELNKKG